MPIALIAYSAQTVSNLLHLDPLALFLLLVFPPPKPQNQTDQPHGCIPPANNSHGTVCLDIGQDQINNGKDYRHWDSNPTHQPYVTSFPLRKQHKRRKDNGDDCAYDG